MREIPLYNGAVAQQGEQRFAEPPQLGHVQGFGDTLDSAIEGGFKAVEEYAELHDFGTRQEVAAKRAALETEREAEWERRSALANGAEGSFWTAEGNLNEDALAEFTSKYAEKDAQIERPYWLRRNAMRDAEATQEATLAANKQVRLAAVREEARRRKDAFETNLELAIKKENWGGANELLRDGVASGQMTKAEAELAKLKMDKARMGGLGRASRGTMTPPAVNVGGKTYHGGSVALAMQAQRDGWKKQGGNENAAEAPAVLAGAGANEADIRVDMGNAMPRVATEQERVTEIQVGGGADAFAIGDEDQQMLRQMTEGPTAPVRADDSWTLGNAYDPVSMDSAAKLPMADFDILRDDFLYADAVMVQPGEDGRMHYNCLPTAPDAVKRVTAQAEEQGDIDPAAAKSMLANITLDAVAQNPQASPEQLMKQFDNSGIYEALGDGDAEVGKVRAQAVVQAWKDRGTAGTTQVNTKAIDSLVAAKVNAPDFGKGQEWKTMEKLNPGKTNTAKWEMPDKEDELQDYKKWWTLYKVYKKYRNEYAAYHGLNLEEDTPENYEDVRDEFAMRAQKFYNWYMKGKEGKYNTLKKSSQEAASGLYKTEIALKLREGMAVGPDGQPVYPGYSSEAAAIKGVLAESLPNDLGVAAAERAEAAMEVRHARLAAAASKKAVESYGQLRAAKHETQVLAKEREKAAEAEAKAAEKAEKAAEKEAERREIQKLNAARMKPVQASWEWDGQDAPAGMPPTCTVPKAEMERLVRELGMEEGHVVYLKCNGKKIMVVGENAGNRVELNASAVQSIQAKPKKGQKYLLDGDMGYSYEFKKVSQK